MAGRQRKRRRPGRGGTAVSTTSLSGSCRAPVLTLAATLTLLAAAPAVARAETVLVLPASGAGISAAYIESARALFVARLARQSTLRIIDMERPPTPAPPPTAEMLRLGLPARADVVVTLDLRRPGPGTTLLTATGLAVPEAYQVFLVTESTSGGPEALPVMVDRLIARALAGEGRDPARGRPRAEGPRTFFVGFRAGARAPRETAGPTDLLLPGAGLYLVNNFARLFVDISFDHAATDVGRASRFGLGCYLPFSPEATGWSPYLGASLRWQWNRFGGQGAAGFVVTPALGVTWRRQRSLGLRVEGGVFYDLYGERGVDRLIPGSSDPHRSYGFELWVGTWL
jgi:hypothetical protein